MTRFFTVFIFLLIGFSVFGQYKKKPQDPFPKPPRYNQSGWFVGPGLTHQLVNPQEKTIILSQNNDTILQSTFAERGNLRAYAEVGRYKIINNLYFFRYLDYGLAYKNYAGIENFDESLNISDLSIPVSSGQNTFSDHYASLFFNIRNLVPLKQKIFLQNSFGVLAEWAFLANRNNFQPGLMSTQKFAPRTRAELTYKFGLGYKYSDRLLIIPSVQTSLLNILPWDGVDFILPYFSSNYKPVIFSLRFIFLNQFKQKKCPPVDAIGIPEGFEQQDQ